MLFKKAGRESWRAWVPGLNFTEAFDLIGRKKIHALWLLFPIVNIFTFVGMCIDLVRSFGRMTFGDSALAAIYSPAAFYLTANSKYNNYVGPAYQQEKEYKEEVRLATKAKDKLKLNKLQAKSPYYKSGMREWIESLVFAVFAAAFIRMFLIEAFIIPTPSMEGSLKVGDFLFVSKAHYGIRTPQTVAMIPLLHNRIPPLNSESYLEKPSLPYFRLPRLENVERFKPVVFNVPDGDSIVVTPQRNFSVRDLKRYGQYDPRMHVITRPVDKRDHYIKRCIGLPGEKLQIKSGQVFIDDKPIEHPKYVQFAHKVSSSKGGVNVKRLDDIGVSVNEHRNASEGYYYLSADHVNKIKNFGPDMQVQYIIPKHVPGYAYPHDEKNFPNWTMDDYGPIQIPAKGQTIAISPQNISLYKRIINAYEGNELAVKNGKVYINGQEADSYTFKMNYYWMMGDNRHNSEDSRVWGYVPEDHIVGKPLFIWFSLKNGKFKDGINWNRIFTKADKR